MKQITIDVTQNDINCGQAGSCTLCPVALALARALEVREGDVGVGKYGLSSGDLHWDTPESVQEFTWNFDFGIHVDPFTFTLPMEDSK